MRRVVLNPWLALGVGVVVLALHGWWWASVQVEQRVEPVAGFGAALIALGLWVAARPFIRSGLAVAVGNAMPPLYGSFAMKSDVERAETREAQRPQVRRDVIAERIIAVAIVVLGTLLNGYSGPIARLLS